MLSWNRQIVLVSAALLAFSALSNVTANATENEPANAAENESPAESSLDQSLAQAAFMQAFEPFCGHAYAARIVEDSAPSLIRMPLHVGDDRSRTWVLTLHPEFIDFQHYHLQQDGSPDDVSPYGGKTLDSGTATRQSFPVDEASKALFIANGLDVSVTNTWAFEFPDGQTMRYQLSRPGRLFEVEVDLSQAIPLPPPAWGYTQPAP